MTFASPWYLYALPFVAAALLALFYWSDRRRQAALDRLGNPDLIRRLVSTMSGRARRTQQLLWLLSAIFLTVALARPQWGGTVRNVEREGVQIVVALDVSMSMLADDIKPNRLERARLEIQDLMSRLQGDEIALVLFSGASFVQFPLTSDYATARQFLESADPLAISKPGTNVSEALYTAMDAFDLDSTSQKVIVLITDGEAHDADAVLAAQAAVDQGALIYTIGFGSPEGAMVPEFDDRGRPAGYKTDSSGLPVISRLDEATLQEIARIGGGAYFRASSSGGEIPELVSQMETLQHGALGETQEVIQTERFQIFLALALCTLVVSGLLPQRSTAQQRKQAAGSVAPRAAGVKA
jgi:Ca-activated chloride channel family protein